MAVSLSKGGNVSLTKGVPNLKKILVGLGWEARATDGADFDLDASAFLLTDSGKVRSDEEFVFYNQLLSPCQSVEHTGDNRTGAGEGDDEAIRIDLEKVPAATKRIVVCVTIHDAETRKQNFGEVYRHDAEWKFKAVGQGFSGGLEAMCSQFGVNVA